MSITEYKNLPKLIDFQDVNIGKLYFFEKFVIGEFNEGITIDFENFKETSRLISKHFSDKDFGFIANRTHSYSLNLIDAKHFNRLFPNLKAYAVVSDALFAKGVFEVENQFFTYNRKIFKVLDEAIMWVEENLNHSI
ncbi:hypothetical protein ACFQ1Q_10750 [Winogradskyella litorisediminis]|uniref:STAS/SEC14 domain-containing protein n=1 Tax=Winogradskyella litorisediminis TaxID=1156618 RepID=A0ABW3N7T6_9FLAO